MILASVVHRRPGIEAPHPSVGRAIPEQTEIGSIPWQRAGKGERGRQKLTREIKRLAAGTNHQVKLVQVSPVDGEGQPAPIGTAENRRVQYIDRFVVDSVQVRASEVRAGIGDEDDCTTDWITQ